MAKKIVYWRRMITAWTIAPSLLFEFAVAPASFAHQPRPTPTKISQSRSRTNRLDFSDTGRPRRRRGGGSRGPCLVTNKPPLTALMPNTNGGLTLAKAPTFWFYVPYSLTPDYLVEFVLKDTEDNMVYKSKIVGKGDPAGVISVQIPSTVSLEAGKNYDWYFLVYCDAEKPNKFDYVNGSVRRVERPDLERQLESTTLHDRITHYANEGIWYEAVTELAERLSASPQDAEVRREWISLMRSLDLEQLSSEPLVPCCNQLKESK
jgi:hypothetical protein